MGNKCVSCISEPIKKNLFLLGLDNAGKTMILHRYKTNKEVSTCPTTGQNVETISHDNFHFVFWDVGFRHKLRHLRKHYYKDTDCIIFVIDSTDRERMTGNVPNRIHNNSIVWTVKQELEEMLQEEQLKNKPMLILANKQDVDTAMQFEQIIVQLKLNQMIKNRKWHIQPCSAKTGQGLQEGLKWITNIIKQDIQQQKTKLKNNDYSIQSGQEADAISRNETEPLSQTSKER